MEQLIYEIAGRKYILIEYPLVQGGSGLEKVKAAIKKYNCIEQGVKDIKVSFWHNSYCTLKVLVPEEHILKFNEET